MAKLVVVLLFALLAGAAVATSAQFEEPAAEEPALLEAEVEIDPHSLPAAFEAWVSAHKKQYATPDEKAKRYQIWAAAQAEIAALNAPAPSIPGVLQASADDEEPPKFSVAGPFSDLTADEFQKSYLSALVVPKKVAQSFLAITEDRREGEVFFETEEDMALAEMEAEAEAETEAEAEVEAEAELGAEAAAELEAASFSWKKISTPVKNQGKCGSCWAHAAASVMESAWAKAGHGLRAVSVQQQVDCNKGSKGCRGGDPAGALSWWKKYGATSSKSYRYTGRNGRCRKKSTKGAKLKTVSAACGGNCRGKNEAKLISDLRKYGPIAVAVNAGKTWQHYNRGVMSPRHCSSKGLNHAVTLVGYSKRYWIVRNSWGAGWGERGYIRIRYGHNTCGIASWCTYAIAN